MVISVKTLIIVNLFNVTGGLNSPYEGIGLNKTLVTVSDGEHGNVNVNVRFPLIIHLTNHR